MTREQYIRMTEATRRAADRLPGGARALRAPTLLCAAIYCASLLYLMFTGDGRIVEVQGTGERSTLDRAQLDALLDLCQGGIARLTELQTDVTGYRP